MFFFRTFPCHYCWLLIYMQTIYCVSHNMEIRCSKIRPWSTCSSLSWQPERKHDRCLSLSICFSNEKCEWHEDALIVLRRRRPESEERWLEGERTTTASTVREPTAAERWPLAAGEARRASVHSVQYRNNNRRRRRAGTVRWGEFAWNKRPH